MALWTRIREVTNRMLASANVRIETNTGRVQERERIERLQGQGWFERPVFPVTHSMANAQIERTLSLVAEYRSRFDDFTDPSRNEVGFAFGNGWYDSPDAEVLYSMVRAYSPSAVVEVGSGNSTKLLRQAIIDGELPTRLISVDPEPRVDIAALADELYRQPIETVSEERLLEWLDDRSILFIDSSHRVATGGDVVFLLLRVLPQLPPGVLVHIHDIVLPYDYPLAWIEHGWGWNEQYLVQAMLESDQFEVLWPAHHWMRGEERVERYFPHSRGTAQSLWLRKVSAPRR